MLRARDGTGCLVNIYIIGIVARISVQHVYTVQRLPCHIACSVNVGITNAMILDINTTAQVGWRAGVNTCANAGDGSAGLIDGQIVGIKTIASMDTGNTTCNRTSGCYDCVSGAIVISVNAFLVSAYKGTTNLIYGKIIGQCVSGGQRYQSYFLR